MLFQTPQEKQQENTPWTVIGSTDYAMQMKKALDLRRLAEAASSTELPADTTVATDNGHGPVHNYPIIQFEFDRVQNPLVIGIWILSASIAKIGK